jgi:hydrogenase maturation protein HypF
MPLPGGDKVTHEPWRTAVSHLHSYYGRNFMNFDLPFLRNIPSSSVELLCSAIEKKINSPLSSGAGRLFDAAAALLNLCTVTKFHAEAPMRLEAVLVSDCREYYPYQSHEQSISFHQTFQGMIDDMKAGVAVSDISAKFHNTVIRVIVETVKDIREKNALNKVVLSGGTFQNKYLLANVETDLLSAGFDVYSHLKVPTSDAGIALGQMLIGASNS